MKNLKTRKLCKDRKKINVAVGGGIENCAASVEKMFFLSAST
jgi:hypothetical protein